MKKLAQISVNGDFLQFDLSSPKSIAIPLQEEGQVNCYYAAPFSVEVIREGSFIGSIKEGGVVNHKLLKLTPHGNGTHTECLSHIADVEVNMQQISPDELYLAQLISVKPAILPNGDLVIDETALELVKQCDEIEAIVVRTIPNLPEKQVAQYSGTNPCYFTAEFSEKLVALGVKHLLVDLPSVDKEVDGGKLLAHKAFWGFPDAIRKDATITELIFVDSKIPDDFYLLSLQTLRIALDVSPSQPVLFPLLKD